MSKKTIQIQEEMSKNFQCLADKYDRLEVWSDFVKLSACRLRISDISKRMREYKGIVSHYSQEDVEYFTKMFELTVDAFEWNPCQDFLGGLYMKLELHTEKNGQYFTPYEACKAMSAIIVEDLGSQLESKCWVSVYDSTCGAGATLIACADGFKRMGINYQQSVLFIAQDIDRIAALMCFIQLSLLGCAGCIVVGDALTAPIVGQNGTLPIQQEGQEIWYTPMMHTDAWRQRLSLKD